MTEDNLFAILVVQFHMNTTRGVQMD